MKIRNGFVSNSSSSSFCLVIKMSVEDFQKKFDQETFRYNLPTLGKDADGNYWDTYVLNDYLGMSQFSGWTSMFNDEDDCGEPFLKLKKILDEEKIPYKMEVGSEG